MLFRRNILQGPATLYRILWHYSVLKGFWYKIALGPQHIMRGLAKFFFLDLMDEEHAVSCIESV